MKLEDKLRSEITAKKLQRPPNTLQGVTKERIAEVLQALDRASRDQIDAVFALLDDLNPSWFYEAAEKGLKVCHGASTAHIACHVGVLQRNSGKLDREGRDYWLKPLWEIGVLEKLYFDSQTAEFLPGHPVPKSPNSAYRIAPAFLQILKASDAERKVLLAAWASEAAIRERLQVQAELAEATSSAPASNGTAGKAFPRTSAPWSPPNPRPHRLLILILILISRTAARATVPSALPIPRSVRSPSSPAPCPVHTPLAQGEPACHALPQLPASVGAPSWPATAANPTAVSFGAALSATDRPEFHAVQASSTNAPRGERKRCVLPHFPMKPLASRRRCVAASPRFAAMNALRKFPLTALLLFPLLCGAPAFAAPVAAVDSASVKTLFKNPPREYSTGPLWVWNDLLTERQIRDTLRDLASQKVKQVWVHPRPGLMTPYLSPDWFRLWKVALNEAQRLDMNVWIYDENSYPSGFAGGWVPELMPESRGRGLAFRETKTAPKWSNDLIGVYRLDGGASENVTAKVKAGAALPEARYLVAAQVRAKNSPWHGNRCYANLLSPGVTEKFLDVTLEAYRREIGKQFGQRVPGVFSDEPNIHPVGDLPWSETLAREFQKRWGYDLLDHLPSLTRPVGDWRKIRHNYFQVLNDQFIEHWSKPYRDYCATNHLEWTGHYWDHEWPNCAAVPDNMAMYAWPQRPGIDCLMNQYAEHTHAQFGNARMVRELSSVANQLGIKRTLCETYGAGGWDLRFEDMKRIGDWLEVLGVNTLDQHLSYVTIRGARKRDHPQSFSYHEPWWAAYHVSAEYFARLSLALSQGEQVNPVLVLEPTTTAWMYQGDAAKLGQIGDSFFQLLMALEAAQIEYDIGDEDIIARHGSLDGKRLRIGNRTYQHVLLPPLIENVNRQTKALLDQVNLTVTGISPERVDGAAPQTSAGSQESLPADWLLALPADWLSKVNTIIADLQHDQGKDDFSIQRAPDDQGILFHHRRQLAGGQILFLVNTSIEHTSSGVVLSSLRGAETWNLYTGEIKPFPFARLDTGISVEFNLPPSGSLLLFLSKKPIEADFPPETVATLPPAGPVEIRRLEPNVLTLDYVDVTAGGETRKDLYFYQANQFAWQKNGLERDPWDSAVQFKDELIRKTFPPASGFTASYKFNLEGAVPKDLAIVIERPDLYTIACNGHTVKAKRNDWWLDKAFGRIVIASAARTGENVVTINASPFTMFHELEPAYVLGDFTLKPAAKGFVIAPPQGLTLGQPSESTARPVRPGWNLQGHPFYSAGVSYRERFDLEKPVGRFVAALPDWYGSVAKVAVNGKPAGFIDAPPWECDVTKYLKRGQNEVEVTVIGTLKNTLGPHHGNPALGAAWPASFHVGPSPGPPPGASYSTVAYGLFEPFVLKQLMR